MYDKPENISDNAQNCFDNLRGFMTTERGIYLPLYMFLAQYGHYVNFLIRGSSEYEDMQ